MVPLATANAYIEIGLMKAVVVSVSTFFISAFKTQQDKNIVLYPKL